MAASAYLTWAEAPVTAAETVAFINLAPLAHPFMVDAFLPGYAARLYASCAPFQRFIATRRGEVAA